MRTYVNILAGKGAKLYGRYAHSSALNLEMNDVLFQLDYIAWNVGSIITSTGSTLDDVADVKVGRNRQIKVQGTPADFLTYGKVGWVSPVGADDWTVFEFDLGAKTATLPEQSKGGIPINEGDIVCVKYVNDRACEEVLVDANFVPSEVTIVLNGDLFKASSTGQIGDITGASKIGRVEVEIPRFQLNGAVNMTLEMTGACNSSLSGTALATTSGISCDESGYYGKIKKYMLGYDWREKVSALVPAGGDKVTMGQGSTFPLSIYAVMPSSNTSKLVDPLDLTYTPSGTGITVPNGVITTSGSASSGSVKVELKSGGTTYATTNITVTVE